MESSEDCYCRLCAQLKHKTKLLDLKSDEILLREVVEKLKRLNSETNLLDDLLPRSVCFECLNSLNRAFQFVLCVEHSQDVLSEIFLKQIKKESEYSGDDDVQYDIYDIQDLNQDCCETTDELKDENVEIKQEAYKDVEGKETLSNNVKCKIKARKKKMKTSEEDDDDAMPLSQFKMTWKDFYWTCSFCETQFTTVDELRIHSMQYHKRCNTYRCPDCNVRKIKLESFLVHVRRHRKYLKLSCYKCYKAFPTSRKANTHMSKYKIGEHVCPGCNTNFSSIEEFNDHSKLFFQYKKNHSAAEPHQSDMQRIRKDSISAEDLTCVFCTKTFKHRGTLNTHLLIHTDRKRDHICDKCGKCFLNKQTLAHHLILHENIRPWQCEICKAAFKTHSQLRNHVGVHDNKKPFACEQCGRCFRLRRQLTSHKIIHTDALPYVCSFCNKSFRFKTILNQHIRQHTGVKPYSCKMCQRDFTNWPNYNKHMKRRHGMDMAKKKHTPDGVYPIDQNTGEVIVTATTEKLLEWKKQMMSNRRPGRPKLNSDDVKTVDKSDTNEATLIS